MTNEELTQIEARAEAATPGPWGARTKGHFTVDREIGCEIAGNIQPGTFTPVCQLWPGFKWYEGDKEFIAHARTDIPALVTEIKRLQAIEQAAQKYITADGPDTYPAYQEFRNLVIASL